MNITENNINIKAKEDKIRFLCVFSMVKLTAAEILSKILDIDICIAVFVCLITGSILANDTRMSITLIITSAFFILWFCFLLVLKTKVGNAKNILRKFVYGWIILRTILYCTLTIFIALFDIYVYLNMMSLYQKSQDNLAERTNRIRKLQSIHQVKSIYIRLPGGFQLDIFVNA